MDPQYGPPIWTPPSIWTPLMDPQCIFLLLYTRLYSRSFLFSWKFDFWFSNSNLMKKDKLESSLLERDGTFRQWAYQAIALCCGLGVKEACERERQRHNPGVVISNIVLLPLCSAVLRWHVSDILFSYYLFALNLV